MSSPTFAPRNLALAASVLLAALLVAPAASAAAPAPEEVARDLLSPRPDHQARAMTRLAGDDPEGAVEGLIGLLVRGNLDPDVHLVVLDALARSKDYRAVIHLEAAMRSGRRDALALGAAWLPAFGGEGRAAALRISQSGLEPARLAGIAALGGFTASADVLSSLRSLLAHPSEPTRRATKRSLSRIGGPEAHRLLGAVLITEDEAVKRTASVPKKAEPSDR